MAKTALPLNAGGEQFEKIADLRARVKLLLLVPPDGVPKKEVALKKIRLEGEDEESGL